MTEKLCRDCRHVIAPRRWFGLAEPDWTAAKCAKSIPAWTSAVTGQVLGLVSAGARRWGEARGENPDILRRLHSFQARSGCCCTNPARPKIRRR